MVDNYYGFLQNDQVLFTFYFSENPIPSDPLLYLTFVTIIIQPLMEELKLLEFLMEVPMMRKLHVIGYFYHISTFAREMVMKNIPFRRSFRTFK